MRRASEADTRGGKPQAGAIEIALVNNMPDQALSSTMAQFSRLVRAGAGERPYRLRGYALPSVARGESARRYLRQTHDEIDALYARGTDALIVTGAEPRAARLDEEPYWPDLARLVDWARDRTVSTIWSCLASHAALLRLDGIERRRLPEKLSGAYAFETTPGDWATFGAEARILAPHSRYNEAPREELERRGYAISAASETAGVDAFWRREPSLFLFLQGHPEYDADSLVKEYRRDALRFVGGERDDYPNPPVGVFSDSAVARLEALRRRTMRGRAEKTESFEARLDAILAAAPVAANWDADASRLYRNWFDAVANEKLAMRRSA